MSDRTKALIMVFSLSHQLQAWLEYARSFGYMTQSFKQESNLLSKQCDKVIRMFGANEDELYEHSIQISDLLEKLSKLDESDVKSVLGLINKIHRIKTKTNVYANSH